MDLVETVDNRFNNYLVTGTLDTSDSTTINITALSGSGWVFESADDSNLKINVDLQWST